MPRHFKLLGLRLVFMAEDKNSLTFSSQHVQRKASPSTFIYTTHSGRNRTGPQLTVLGVRTWQAHDPTEHNQ